MNFKSTWSGELMPVTLLKFLVFVLLTYVVNLLYSLWIGYFWSSICLTCMC